MPSGTVTSVKARLIVAIRLMTNIRYPGYSSWVEVLQKLKAAGFNTVSTYFFWGMIEHRRGDFNWDGFRDPQAFFDAAKEAGVWVISRPGPYINAEVSCESCHHGAKFAVNATEITALPLSSPRYQYELTILSW